MSRGNSRTCTTSASTTWKNAPRTWRPASKKFQSKATPTVTPSKAQLKKAFTASSRAVETFLEDVLAGAPKRKGFKKGIFTTLSYFIAHESHHRGSILLTLKEAGHNLNQADRYAIWSWDTL